MIENARSNGTITDLQSKILESMREGKIVEWSNSMRILELKRFIYHNGRHYTITDSGRQALAEHYGENA